MPGPCSQESTCVRPGAGALGWGSGAWSETTHPSLKAMGFQGNQNSQNNPEKQAESWRTHIPQEVSFKADYEGTEIKIVWPWQRDQTRADEPRGPPGGCSHRARATSWGARLSEERCWGRWVPCRAGPRLTPDAEISSTQSKGPMSALDCKTLRREPL